MLYATATLKILFSNNIDRLELKSKTFCQKYTQAFSLNRKRMLLFSSLFSPIFFSPGFQSLSLESGCFELHASGCHTSTNLKGILWRMAASTCSSWEPKAQGAYCIHLCLSVVYFFFIKLCCYYYTLLSLFLTLFSLLFFSLFHLFSKYPFINYPLCDKGGGQDKYTPSHPQPIRKDGLIFTTALTYNKQSTVSIHFRVNKRKW